MTEIIGHASIVNFFDRCIERGTLSHAYAFVGPRHVGKRTVAEHISRTILKITSTSFSHPDLIVIQRELDEKTGMLKKDISIAQVRELVQRFSQSAFVREGYVVVIIDGAEYLNVSAANALLKTLEEPRTKTIVFLITENEQALIPTIRSRVQTLYFSPVSPTVIHSFLTTKGIANADQITSDTHGIPGLACLWAADPVTYEVYTQEKLRIQSLFSLSFHEKIQKIEDFFADADDHVQARSRIIEALRVWIFTLRDMMMRDFQHMSVIPSIVDAIHEAEKRLKNNIHPRLVMEHVILAIP